MLKIKICGLMYPSNIAQVVQTGPDYIGFIFYPESPRYCSGYLEPGLICDIPATVKKTGVFVNDTVYTIKKNIFCYSLDLVQLHGDESPQMCHLLKSEGISVVKAFQIGKNFNFGILKSFKPYCDFFLFDTQNRFYGGSGNTFDWTLLSHYNNEKPFFLSGGIDLNHIEEILGLNNLNIHAVDINSKFEHSPGLKDVNKVREFVKSIRKSVAMQ
jgi:phosphoribosylanthranilate isomerase